MSRHGFSWIALYPLLTACAGCIGTTGGDLFTFSAFAAGPEGAEAAAGGTYSFKSGRDYTVSLTRARLHIGAVYLNNSVPSSVAASSSCALAGIYTAEVTTGLFVDVLSSTPQRFPAPGSGTSERAPTGEIWLNGGDVNDPSDTTVILDIQGTAEKDGISYPFEGQVTISTNRVSPVEDVAQPGSNPICKQRIVTPIPTDIQPTTGGALLVRVNPRGWFGNVEFAALERVSDAPPLYRFADSSEDPPSRNLYGGLTASGETYSFHWQDRTP